MEAIFEIIFEVVFELIFGIIDIVYDKTADRILNDTKAKKVAKIMIGIILLAVGVLFLSISISYKKGHLVILSLSFLLSFIILNFILFLNKNQFNKTWINVIVKIVKSISRYVLLGLLIYFAKKDLPLNAATLLMVISIFTIIFCFMLDVFYLTLSNKRRQDAKKKVEEKKNKELMDDVE